MPKSQTNSVVETFLGFSRQIADSYREAKLLNLSKIKPKNLTSIVSCGMGGSNLHAELFLKVTEAELKLPLTLVRDYHLPKFAGSKTLAVITSYSGTTEETINCLKEAKQRKCPVVVITTGGPLRDLAKKLKLPIYLMDASLNPSNQPRYGVGLQVGALLGIFDKLGLYKIKEKDLAASLEKLTRLSQVLSLPADGNPAAIVARALAGKTVMIVGAQFLSANAHILANQINESDKNLAFPFAIPELNHHLMEGLELPNAAKKTLHFLFLNSSLYEDIISRRIAVTQKVLRRQKIGYTNYFCSSCDPLASALEALIFGSWVSYYLSLANKVNATEIPWVNFFKAELKK